MTVFADSSALVTLYADEPGSSALRDLPALVVSSLARVEVASALWRKQRDGALEPEDAALLTTLFEADYLGDGERAPRFIALAVTSPILDEAARLATNALRPMDAVHLATALAARRADPDCATFACLDRRLRAAAGGAGFALLPEETPLVGVVTAR